MNRNVGRIDRALRIVAGIVIFFLFFALEPPMHYIGLIGLVPLATGFLGWCPPYSLFGINTCSVDETEPQA
ncbi:DUF2892 domain-containing protein [Magnetospira sp. QH-2]|uniref:YgaP family membrane protein n=1 Tax=Magnetospira sp. (strain QH-2) TaxID=1288970 RepID=UPI0003E81AC8|nr:DUF2892 domain-containing protein [Magnetospira sp. QH-2]CCQ74066.1 Conserved protein of unknown function [Magnetospira sp. QH-2]